MIISLIVGLILGGAAVIFALQNVSTISVTFFAWQIESSLAVIIILAIAIGVIISTLLSLPGAIKKSFQISGLKKHNSKLESDLIDKKIEVESEKSKLVANNAYLDDLENTSK